MLLALIALGLILYVYSRDGRSKPARILLGCIRALLVAFVLVLLNRPVLVNVAIRGPSLRSWRYWLTTRPA